MHTTDPRLVGRVVRRGLMAGALFLGALQLARGQSWTDWTSDDGTTAVGTVGGTTVSLTRDINGVFGANNYIGTGTFFQNTTYAPAVPFTPSFASSDFIEVVSQKLPTPAQNYTISFGTSVVDPILLIASLASTLTFDATPTFLAGTDNSTSEFVVSGNQVSGTYFNGAYTDANGTVKFLGTFTSISFTTLYAGPTSVDGVILQVGITAVPEPATSAALAGLGMVAFVGWVRRRAA